MRRLGERGRFLGLGGVTWPDWAGGWYSSSPESSEAPSRALEIVTAAALAVFRRGRGKTGWRCCGMVMDAILYEFKVKWGSFGPLLNRLKLQILDDDFNKSLSLDNTTAVTTPVAYNSVFIGFRRGSRSSFSSSVRIDGTTDASCTKTEFMLRRWQRRVLAVSIFNANIP